MCGGSGSGAGGVVGEGARGQTSTGAKSCKYELASGGMNPQGHAIILELQYTI